MTALDWTTARIQDAEQLAFVLSEKLDDDAPLNLRTRWLPLAEELWGRITPMLDADGLPVVHTVGDLTARHQLTRPRIRVAGREGKLKIVKPSDAYPGTVTLIWGDWWEDAAPEEPCEVLS